MVKNWDCLPIDTWTYMLRLDPSLPHDDDARHSHTTVTLVEGQL